MKPADNQFSSLEGSVAFRLFADQDEPTLTVSEQIAAQIGDRILSGQLIPGELRSRSLPMSLQSAEAPFEMRCAFLSGRGLRQFWHGAVQSLPN